MHGDPGLWASLIERLADIAVASLRSQVAAGAQAVQLFDSWAGSSGARRVRALRPPRRHARCSPACADLGVPAILFGVGTGELLALMGSAGADVVGVDWRVPLDEARRRVGTGHALQGNLDPALCLAPWPVVEDATQAVLAAAAAAGGGHVFNLGHGVLPETDPGVLAAVVELVHAGGGPGMSVGVLVMAHGTPLDRAGIEPFYTRIRRGRPPEPEQLAELERRYEAIGGTSPLAERTAAQVEGIRRALEDAAPGRYVVAFGAKHTDPAIEDAAAGLVERSVERVVGLVLTPQGSSMGSQEYLERAAAALAGTTRLVPVGPWYAEPALVSLLARRVRAEPRRHARPLPGRVHRALPARPHHRGRGHLPRAGGRVGAAWWPRPRASRDGRWPGRARPRSREPWLGPDVRDVVRDLARRGKGPDRVDAVVLCPVGFVADHLEVLYDLDVEVAAVAAEHGLAYARTASLNDDPAFVAMLAGLIMAADAAEGVPDRGMAARTGERRTAEQ